MIRRLAVVVVVAAAAACTAEAPTPVAAADATPAATTAAAEAPDFDVDPLWPKPLPNHWVLGSTIGVSIDDQDHIWIIHRPGSVDDNFKAAAVTQQVGRCSTPAPPVLEFDQDGTLVQTWGGPGPNYEWPIRNHGVT